MSEKQILFISHSSKDGEMAKVLKREIEAMLDIEVWHSSEPDSIKAGSKWFSEIVQKLDKAKAFLVIVSSDSRSSAWVHWEIGYFYKKAKDEGMGDCIFVATKGNEPPFPTLSMNQAKSLKNQAELFNLLDTLSVHFGHESRIINWSNSVDVISKIANPPEIAKSSIEGLYRKKPKRNMPNDY